MAHLHILLVGAGMARVRKKWSSGLVRNRELDCHEKPSLAYENEHGAWRLLLVVMMLGMCEYPMRQGFQRMDCSPPLTPNGLRVLLRSPVQEKNCYKVQFRRVFWNWCINESYKSWIFDSMYTVRFTNAIINILLYIWNLKF
jgi:hypothetical protein